MIKFNLDGLADEMIHLFFFSGLFDISLFFVWI